jgi:hypothetical protein
MLNGIVLQKENKALHSTISAKLCILNIIAIFHLRTYLFFLPFKPKKTKYSVAFSPRVNYTD